MAQARNNRRDAGVTLRLWGWEPVLVMTHAGHRMFGMRRTGVDPMTHRPRCELVWINQYDHLCMDYSANSVHIKTRGVDDWPPPGPMERLYAHANLHQ